MNNKSTQKRYTPFEELFVNSVYDLFSPQSSKSLINYKELNLVNWKELNVVKWSDLKLVNVSELSRGFQYIGMMSFLVAFLGSIAFGILLDEKIYSNKLSFSRLERKFALDKAMFERSADYLASQRVMALNIEEMPEAYVESAVLGVSDVAEADEVASEVKQVESEVSEVAGLNSLDEIPNGESLYRDGVCSFSTDGILYSSGAVISPSNDQVVCVKSWDEEASFDATVALGGEDPAIKPLNMTNSCFSASKIKGTSMVNVSLVGANNTKVGGCSLLVSAL